MHVGIIGLGIMGGAMAEAALKAGHRVTGYDPAAAARRRLKRAGGTAAIDNVEVAAAASTLILSLASERALRSVVRDLQRVPGRGRVVIETSTLPLRDKEQARSRLQRAGYAVLDCPISGTAVRLKDRTWTIFASGAARDVRRARRILSVFADNVPFVGTFGNGTRMKFVANHLVAILNVASAETLNFGRRMGLDPREVLAVFGPSPVVGTGVLRLRGQFMVRRRYRPATMRIEVWQKDMRIIGAMARRVRAAAPLFHASAAAYKKAMRKGYARADTASVYEILRRATPA